MHTLEIKEKCETIYCHTRHNSAKYRLFIIFARNKNETIQTNNRAIL